MFVYALTTIMVQFLGFLISRLVDLQYPALSVMTFLMLFLAAFGLAWPIAVYVTEWLHLTPRADTPRLAFNTI